MKTRLLSHTDVEQVAASLLAVYAQVREPLLHLPDYAVRTVAGRLERYGRTPGFKAVLAFDREDRPVGYAYGNTVEAGDLWWRRMRDVDERHTQEPALALREIGVTTPHRGTGLAREIHDTLLAGRTEPFASLMVNPAAGDGKVRRVYESWGYAAIGTCRLSPDAPVLTAMIRKTAVQGVLRKSRTAPTAPGTHSRRTGRSPEYAQYEGLRPARREQAPDTAGTAQDFRNTP